MKYLVCCLLMIAGLIWWITPARAPESSVIEVLDQKARPSDWAVAQRLFPHDAWDKNAYRDAQAHVRSMQAVSKTGQALGTWTLAGPTNFSGRVTDIAFDPLQPNIVYAGAATGGMFKSEDTGRTWRPVFDAQPILNVGDVAVDPVQSGVVYVGTGEANPTANNLAGGGLYKSVDGGASWAFSGLQETVSISRILVSPANPERVFVAAAGSYFGTNPERGIFRTDDGGETWTHVLAVSDSTGAIDLVMHPTNPDVLYAAFWERVRYPDAARLNGPTSGIFQTTDGGETWTRLGPETGLPDAEQVEVGRIGLAISEGNPEVLYALYNDGRFYVGLYRTNDGGVLWVDVDPDQRIQNGTDGFTFSFFFGQVRVSPVNPDEVFVLDVDFMHSMDAGVTWETTLGNSVFHVDHHALAFHPENPQYLLDGNDGGINLSEDGGQTWQRTTGLTTTQFYEIGLDPNNPERLYGGTQDNGGLRTLTGQPDDWEPLRFGIGGGGDGFYTIVAEENSDFIYAESQYGNLFKTSNGGERWSPITLGVAPRYVNELSPADAEPRNWSTPVVIDQNDNAVLYYGTNRVYRAATRGTRWVPISPSLTDWQRGSRFGTITTLAVAPTNSNVLYAGTDDGHVWVSRDYGTTWEDVSAGLPQRWVTRVAVDPTAESIVYVSFSGLKWKDPQPHIFRSADYGATWQDVTDNLPDAPVNALAVDPVDPDVVYAGTDVGAFISFSGGGTWETLGEELPAVSVYDLKIHPTEHYIAAGTHGRGIYKLDLNNIATASNQEVPQEANAKLHPNYPNPFTSHTTLSYTLDEPGQVQLDVYDLQGRCLHTLASAPQPAGTHTLTWNGQNAQGTPLPSGIYMTRLTVSESIIASRPVVVQR